MMLARTGFIPWIGVLILAVAASGTLATPAQASGRTAKVLAGLAVGALVYSALDDDCRSSHGSRYSPPAHPRYDPPPPYARYGYWERPKDTYDRGYSDGWKDGYGYGKNEGRREGYSWGYGDGYGDGRHDQWVSDRYGAPYSRYAEKSYGGCW